jgi:hypothetical protein
MPLSASNIAPAKSKMRVSNSKDRCATHTVLVWVQHCTRYTAAIHIWLAITLANGVRQAGNREAKKKCHRADFAEILEK